ncbi:MAG: phosphoribosylformylglycinamidine synthase [Phycisphaerales bacterium]|nr:phosphoribosylformylglycinamidine synthase [Phycisphaerales bacterium]
MKPKTLILRTAGTNCDGETAHAFELAGATVDVIHLNRILEQPTLLDGYQMLALAGGFSYGDDIAAGRILANQITQRLGDDVRRFIDAGKPVIGICNGFQVLVKTDLLPGKIGDAKAGQQSATLTHNDCGRFVCEWIRVKSVSKKCVWTADLGEIELPIAHGEGKFVTKSPAVLAALHENDQIALTYVGTNPNGSTDAIAGVCDESGLVLGLMPHPERHVRADQHPAWTSRAVLGEGQGLTIFRNAVRHVTSAVGSGV